MYNVLWLDDEFEKFDTFEAIAAYKGIHLEPFDVRKKGIEELQLHHDQYDAVLLDAKMPETSINAKQGIDGVKTVVNLAHEFHIPIYISTGQPDLKQDTTFKASFENVYIKGDATDQFGGDTELLHDMLETLGKAEEGVALRRYANVIVSLEGLGIKKEGKDILMPILCALHNPEKHTDFQAKRHYNQLRTLVEYVFRSFNKAGLLPDDFIQESRVNNTESYRYLVGKEPKYIPWKRNGEVIPSRFSLIGNILYSGNINSHSNANGGDTLDLDYLLLSYTMMLCEFIIWANEYVKEHNDIETNKSEWIRFEPQIEQTTT